MILAYISFPTNASPHTTYTLTLCQMLRIELLFDSTVSASAFSYATDAAFARVTLEEKFGLRDQVEIDLFRCMCVSSGKKVQVPNSLQRLLRRVGRQKA